MSTVKSTIKFALLGCAIFFCGGGGVSLAEAEANPPTWRGNPIQSSTQILPSPKSLSAAQIERIGTFFRDCVGWPGIGEVQIIRTTRSLSLAVLPRLEIRVTGGPLAESEEVSVDPVSGTVWQYFAESQRRRESDEVETRVPNDAISEDDAWKSALRVLTYYGLLASRQQYKLEMRDYGTSQRSSNLREAYWNIRKDFTYREVPCIRRYIDIQISALTGRVRAVWYNPVVVPKGEPQRLISQGNAIERSEAWLAERTYFSGKEVTLDKGALESVREVIAIPNSFWYTNEKYTSLECSEEAFWCWEVPFAFVEHGHEFTGCVWVRMDTGTIIGGF